MAINTFKLVLITLATFVTLSFIVGPALAADKFKAVTTFTVIADIARNVAGDAAIVESITKPGAEIHDYQPTPQDIIRAQDADVILWNGLNLERWFERFLADVQNVPSVIVSEGVEPLSIYEGPYSGKPNPHAWMSTQSALIYIENIRKAFAEMDPANAQIYTANAKVYAEKVQSIKAELEKTLSGIPDDRRYLVTSEGAFSYLAKDLNMREVYLWPMNADQQGTPQQVRQVIDTVREKNIPVIFSESTISDKPARQVASETAALYGGVLYVDSLSEPDGKVPTYLDLLQVTTRTIANGFKEALNN
ncbi:MAG: metal ABC transporter substrate-binding protein [Micavibrio sp.]|nr:metal ABC transporter substrate-binding protein [Micavibrio sp.]|tara:strand:- start:971 stop:1888 length:918 start_codon:yes stop_codon:yes gene_type:complete